MFGLPAVNDFDASLFTYYFKSVFPYIMPIIYPVGMIAQTGSVYLASTGGLLKLSPKLRDSCLTAVA